MTSSRTALHGFLAFWSTLLFTAAVSAQTPDDQIVKAVLHQDSLFWKAYNSCDTAAFRQFFTGDVEFYHDKGGLTVGIDAVIMSSAKNLCTGSTHVRREAVDGSTRVFPMRKDGEPYAAVMTGEHVFYIVQEGKNDRPEGVAKFAHTWVLRDGSWKMARILSYDHQPAPYVNKRSAIVLPSSTLDRYTGNYRGPVTGDIAVRRGDGNLVLIVKGKEFGVYPENETTFFSKERDLTFEFVGAKTVAAKMIVRELGAVAEELTSVR